MTNLAETINAIGQDITWEVRRLVGDTSCVSEEISEILDFGDTPWMGYRVAPFGVIAMHFQSEYMKVHGVPRLIHDGANPLVANVITESRYRSVVATGDVLCDREWYEINADGSIEAYLSICEVSTASGVEDREYWKRIAEDEDGNKDFEDERYVDITHTLFGQTSPPEMTASQQANERLMTILSDAIEGLADDDPAVRTSIEEIHRIEHSGEDESCTNLKVSVAGLKQLLARLKLLEEEDKLGNLHVFSTIHNFVELK